MWGVSFGFHVEVDLCGFPVFGYFDQHGADKSQERVVVGEQCGDSRSTFDFLVDAFEHIGSSQPASVGGREGEDGQVLRNVLLQPGCQFGGGFLVFGESLLQQLLSGGAIGSVEDAADVGGDLFSHADFGHVMDSILVQMELAALPGDAWEDSLTGGLQSGVIVAGNELHAVHAAFSEGSEEFPPMDFGLGE